jgi:DNA-directed RNA polymerase specialized sigma24 family protein
MKIDGKYRIGNNRYLYLNSVTGAGFPELLKAMRGFLNYQSNLMEFPSFSKEDIEQEMLALAIEALPRYDETKNANLITFLQNHIKNRLINMCKFFSEKRRCAVHVDTGMQKVRCNACRTFFRAEKSSPNLSCVRCGCAASRDSGSWKFYNLIAIPGQVPVNDEDNELDLEIDPDLAHVAAIGMSGSTDPLVRMDLERFLGKETELSKSIISLVCQGYSRSEVARELDVPSASVGRELSGVVNRLRKFLNEEKQYGVSAI